MLPPELFPPALWEQLSPFVKSAVIGFGPIVTFGGPRIYHAIIDWRVRRRTERIEDDVRKDRQAAETKLQAREEVVWNDRERRIDALDKQHAYDLKSIRDYQEQMVDLHEEIGWLRGRIEDYARRAGEPVPKWKALEPIPQPSVNPPDFKCE